MKQIVKTVVIGLSVIGAISIVHFVNKFLTYEREAKVYLERCKDIKVGMTIKEVREIMGDSTWNSMENHGEFRFKYYGQNKFYILDYPSVFAASGWPIIEFDVENLRVINISCDNE